VTGEPVKTPAPAAPPVDAAAWFKDLTEVDYPTPSSLEGLTHLAPNIWSSFVTPESRVIGLPQFLSVTPVPQLPTAHRVLGFAGRGLNRYAIYYTVQDGTNDIRLRLAFGGMFMNKVERREGVLADLRLVEWLSACTLALPVRCTIRFGVGDREIRLTTTGQRRRLYDCFLPRRGFPYDKVTADLARVLEGVAPSSDEP
jgi:hypothetical protein